jgi:proteasome lid subunit RPN8/RPN11
VSLLATEKVVFRDASSELKLVRRRFPGPERAEVALRVAMERNAYAELVAHAKESLQAEVCGVLVGEVCADDEGVFVHIKAVIRGAEAAEGSTHVTFTQATWNSIHHTLEHNYPLFKIVGWYHTHPGFSVEFSDLDLFIQKNFFPGPAQLALVTDPLSSQIAICINTAQGPRYLPRFWMDGREQPGCVPERRVAAAENCPSPAGGNPEAAIRQLEVRVGQLIRTLDEQQASSHRVLLLCGAIFCVAVIAAAGYFVYSTYTSKLEPPRLNSYVPVPIQIGDKTVLLGVGVAEWKVPDELNALLLHMELLKKAAAEKAAKEAAQTAAPKDDASPPATTNPPGQSR